jgi:Cu+-exporting ATPase
MALEPELPSLDDEENPELVDFRRRFWWTLPLTVVVTVLAMFGHRLGFFDMATQTWVELVLSTPVVLWAGLAVLRAALGAVDRQQASPNMWTLIGTRDGRRIPLQRRRYGRARHLPELVRLDGPRVGLLRGRRRDHLAHAARAAPRAQGALADLGGPQGAARLAPKTARRIKPDGTEEDVPLSHVHVGDSLRVQARRESARRRRRAGRQRARSTSRC